MTIFRTAGFPFLIAASEMRPESMWELQTIYPLLIFSTPSEGWFTPSLLTYASEVASPRSNLEEELSY